MAPFHATMLMEFIDDNGSKEEEEVLLDLEEV